MRLLEAYNISRMDAVDLGSSLCVSFTMKPQEKMIIEGSCGLGFKMPSL